MIDGKIASVFGRASRTLSRNERVQYYPPVGFELGYQPIASTKDEEHGD
jgi:hypothetical protein